MATKISHEWINEVLYLKGDLTNDVTPAELSCLSDLGGPVIHVDFSRISSSFKTAIKVLSYTLHNNSKSAVAYNCPLVSSHFKAAINRPLLPLFPIFA